MPPCFFSHRFLITIFALFSGPATALIAEEVVGKLPLTVTFKGDSQFHRLSKRAQKENWAALPMGERVGKFGRALAGTPYVGFTLEIDDSIEAPSANFEGVDCWTFFEICMGMARMIETGKSTYAPADLLAEIKTTRYRGGQCSGNYLERIHYLVDWYYDNEARGTIDNVTRELGGAERLTGRSCTEMTELWKHYRYLKNSAELREGMKEHEARVSQLPVYFIPKAKVAAVQARIQEGDILGIVTNKDGVFCSHVGLAIKADDGTMRMLHASSNFKKVVDEATISDYLNNYSSHKGIIVGRPQPRSKTITNERAYQTNLKKLIKGS
ncbi:MAG: DUF1460 domain-containing protein [Verrucomicrobia bacterium]|nr:DUF1460 domain-containing protein [Verrucomicrobiota bacterium]